MRDLTLRVTADTDQAEQALKRVERGLGSVESSADKAGQAAGGVGLSLASISKAAGGYVAIQQSLENLVTFAGGSIEAFSGQEQAAKRLTIALEQSGQATPAVISQYAALASQIERTTRFSDDALIELEALFTLTGKVGPEQMGLALQATTNLAIGLGKSLPDAAQLVIQAMDGQVRGLGRYLTEVEKADIKTRGATGALEAINAHFGGQAQADLETYTGRVANMGNRWNNFQERAGDMLARVLLPLLDLFDAMPESLQTAAFAIGSVTAVLAPLAGGVLLVANAFGVSLMPLITGGLMAAWTGFAGLITSTILPLLTAALPLAIKGLAALFSVPAGLIIAGILAVVAIWKNWDTIGPIVERVYTAVKTWLVDKFAVVVQWIGEKVGQVTGFFKDMYMKVVGGSYVPDMITGVEVHFAKLNSVMVAPTRSAADAVANIFRQMAGTVLGALQPMFTGLQQSIATHVPALFGGTGLFGQMMTAGLGAIFGPGGLAATLAMKGMELLAGLVGKGLRKIGGWIRGLFGGPSGDELAGRELVADFEQVLDGMLTDAQRLETGNEAWKNTVVAIRDKYLSLGLTEEEALRDAERLWASSREGAEAAKRVIEEIQRKFEGGITVPVRVVTELPTALGDLTPRLPPVVDGLASDYVSRAMAGTDVPMPGVTMFGPSPGATTTAGGDVTINVAGYLDSKQSAMHLASIVRRELDEELQRRRRMTRG